MGARRDRVLVFSGHRQALDWRVSLRGLGSSEVDTGFAG